MKKIVTFGEIMLRLAPEGYFRFEQADKFCATYGGAEANVAVSLARFGENAHFVTKIPQNPIGDACLRCLRAEGVNTSDIVRGGERLGIYYAEKGASQRPSKVVYDRKYSSVSEALPSDFDWENILSGADWFHFTGITPALSEKAAVICLDALQACKKLNIPASCDLNFRKNLWTSTEAGRIMGGLMPYVSLCIANEEDADKVFGIKAAASDVETGKLDREGYVDVARQLSERFGCKAVAITLRESLSAFDNNWAGMLYTGGESYFSTKYSVHIVDRVGGGDSFGAGLIYSLVNGKEPQYAVDFAVAASCLKHSIEGDFNRVSVSEVEALMSGGGSGRVQR